MTDPRILDGTIRGYREPLPCYRAPTANDFSGAVSVSCMATTCCQRQVEMSYSLPSRNVLFWPAGWSAVARPPPVGHDAASECG